MMQKLVVILAVMLASTLALAQKSPDADKQKIMDIEDKLAATSGTPGPEMTAAFEKYLYDGPVSFIDPFGRLFRMQRSALLEQTSKPDPSDPDAKSIYKNSDYQVDFYGDAALVAYKETTIDSGHREAALNGEYSMNCLDTFVKSKGQWYGAGSACVPSTSISPERWAAVMKMRAQEKPNQ